MQSPVPLTPENTGHYSLLLKGWSWWLLFPLAWLLAWVSLKLYSRETAGFGRQGALLRAARAAVVALLTLLLLQPVAQHSFSEYQPPLVLVLRDNSDSMAVKDTHVSVARKLKIAVELGWLDPAARDTSAEAAAEVYGNARELAGTAQACLRQAQQLLREIGPGASAARERTREARDTLSKIRTDTTKAAALLKTAATHADKVELASDAVGCSVHIERLELEIKEIDLDARGAPERLQDKALALKLLLQELDTLADTANKLQEFLDQALAARGAPAIRAALNKVDQLTRAKLADELFDKKIAPAYNGKIQLVNYFFDTDLHVRPGFPGKAENPTDQAAPDTSELHETDMATPLYRLAERHAQEQIAAVVMCGDGRHTTGSLPEDAARTLAGRGIPLHLLGIGALNAPPDICVARLDGTLSVFLEESIHLTAHIRVTGYTGQSAKLVLKQDGKQFLERTLALSADGWLHEEFEFPASNAGPNIYEAAVEPLAGEALTLNNSAEALVDVSNDRLKVLLVDEQPRWESRYLASLLRRERKMTLDERWLLSGTNLGSAPQALPADQQTLDEYDIVILGDVPVERLDPEAQMLLLKYIADRGGFLVLIAGPKYLPRSYQLGPLAELLPVQPQPPGGVKQFTIALSTDEEHASAPADTGVKVRLDALGARHEITRILRDPILNEQLWLALPELPWHAHPSYAKPGATTLLRTADQRDVLCALQNFGAGRVLYLGTDETWRWRYKVGDRVHSVFWSQALRWGTSNRLTGGDRLKLGLSRRQVRPGESVEVLARPLNEAGKAHAGCMVIAELEDKNQPQKVHLLPMPGSGGLYRGVLQNVSAGLHVVTVKVESPGFENVEEKLEVIASSLAGQEGVELSRDSVRLAAMARAGNGTYRDILEAQKLFDELSTQGKLRIKEKPFELWASYPALLLVVGLLTLEWILRKRMGLS